jgi:hypothetical protein
MTNKFIFWLAQAVHSTCSAAGEVQTPRQHAALGDVLRGMASRPRLSLCRAHLKKEARAWACAASSTASSFTRAWTSESSPRHRTVRHLVLATRAQGLSQPCLDLDARVPPADLPPPLTVTPDEVDPHI